MLSEEEELAHLQSMFKSAKALSQSSDPFLQGYFGHLVGRLAGLLTIKDPETAYQPVVDLE